MNSENAGSLALIPIRLFQSFEDVLLLKIVPGLKQSHLLEGESPS